MTGSNDVAWDPQPLPEVLVEQLRSHGFEPTDTAEIARQIGESVGPAAAASLFVDLGACNFLDGDIDGAIATWRRAVASGQMAPGARALLNLGLLYEHLHLHDRAISVLRSAAERGAEPFATEASIAESRCHCAKGDNNAGLTTLARLTENLMVNQPRSGLLGHALLRLGDVARQAGRPDRAERAWKAAASSHIASVENGANDRLISLLVDLGRDDEARQVIDQSTTSRASLSASQRLARAEMLIELSREPQAVELLATVQSDQLSIAERFRLTEVLVGQGLINESIDHLESLVELPLVDHYLRARYALGEVYRLHGMSPEAEAMYQTVIDENHRYWSPKAGLRLGDLHDEREDLEGAVSHWVRAAASPVLEVREDAEARLTERVTASITVEAEVDHTASLGNATTFTDVIANTDEQALSLWLDDDSWSLEDAVKADAPEGSDLDDSESPPESESETAEVEPEPELAEPELGEPELAEPELAEPEAVKPAPVVVPPSTVAPTIIPLRAPPRIETIIPPASVEVAPVAESYEPLVVALGAVRNTVEAPRSSDPFAELAPDDLDQLGSETGPRPGNPYAELSPQVRQREEDIRWGTADTGAYDEPMLDEPLLDSYVADIEPAPLVQALDLDTEPRDGESFDEWDFSSPPAPAEPSEPLIPEAVPFSGPGTGDGLPTGKPTDVPGAMPFTGATPADELRWQNDAPSSQDSAATDDESGGFFSSQLDD